jgi:large subunit ribosomal protein L6
MSRIGNKPIPVPAGVEVKINGSSVAVAGSGHTLTQEIPPGVTVTFDAGERVVRVARAADDKQHRALHGLARALVANMVDGVSKGFERRLLIYGTGYSCDVANGRLLLNVGFMGRGTKEKPQFSIPIPDGVEVKVEVKAARGDSEPAKLLIHGPDKQRVGMFSADVRKIRPAEPYKGKGIRYEDEQVRRKQGKAFASGSA